MTDHVTQAVTGDVLAWLDRTDDARAKAARKIIIGQQKEVDRLSAELAARSGGWEEWYERGFQTAKDGAEKLARERVGAAPMSRGEVLICDNIASAISSMEAPSHG